MLRGVGWLGALLLAALLILLPARAPRAAGDAQTTIVNPVVGGIYDLSLGAFRVNGYTLVSTDTLTGLRVTVDANPAVDLSLAQANMVSRGGPFNFTLDPAVYGAGSHTLTIQAIGTGGVEAVGDSNAFTITNAHPGLPVLGFELGSAAGVIQTATGFSFIVRYVIGNQPTTAYEETTRSNVAGVPGGAIATQSGGLNFAAFDDSTFPTIMDLDVSEGTSGLRFMGVRVSTAGADSDLFIRGIALDPDAPNGTLALGGGTAYNGPVSFSGSVSDSFLGANPPAMVREARLVINDGTSDVYNQPVTLQSDGTFSHMASGLADGSYTADLEVTDYADNTDASPATVAFSVDTVAPDVEIGDPQHLDNIGSSMVEISGAVTDAAPSSGLAATFNLTIDRLSSPDGSVQTAGVVNTSVSHVGGEYGEIFTLADGFYRATVTATDNAGNNGSDNVAFTIDTTSPTVSIADPTTGETIQDRTFNVTGSASDATSGLSGNYLLELYRTASFGGGVVETVEIRPFSAGSTYDETVTVPRDGFYRAIVTAFDNAGNSGSQTVNFAVNLPPTLEIVSPTECALSTTVPIEVNVTDTNLSSVTISLDGTPIPSGQLTVNTSGDTTTYTASRTLGEGRHTLTVTALDRPELESNVNSLTRTFTVDATAPQVLSINTPTEGQVRSGHLPFVAPLADNLGLASWTLQLRQGSPSGTVLETWTGSVSGPATTATATVDTARYEDGAYALTLQAVDACGNASSVAERNFVIDNTHPEVSVGPEDCVTDDFDPSTPGFQVEITAAVLDANFNPGANPRPWTLLVDGESVGPGEVSVSFAGGYTYLTTVQTLDEGEHTVDFGAEDAAVSEPNWGSASTTFVVDVAPPQAELRSPRQNQVRSGIVEVQGEVRDATGLDRWVLYLDQVELANRLETGTVQGTNHRVSTTLDTRTLTPGVHQLILVAWDACDRRSDDAETFTNMAGQETGRATVSFVVDNAAPVIALTQPVVDAQGCVTQDADSGTPGFQVVLAATVSEPNFGSVTLTLDGTPLAGVVPVVNGSNRTYTTTVTLTDGPHTFAVAAADSAENAANTASTSRSFVVDTAPPTAVLTQPLAGATLPAGVVEVRGTVADSGSLAKWELFLDPANPASPQESERVAGSDVSGNSASVQATLDLGPARRGLHTLVLRATDACGRVSSIIDTGGSRNQLSFTIDNTAPTQAQITAPANGVTVPCGVLEVRGIVADAVQLKSWELFLDPDSTSNPTSGRIAQGDVSGTSAQVLTTLSLEAAQKGTHTLVLRARDTAENTFVGSPVTFTVDNTAPSRAELLAPAEGSTISVGTVEVRGLVEDAVGLKSWELYLDPDVKENPTTGKIAQGNVSGTAASVLKTLTFGANQLGTHVLVLKAFDTCDNSFVGQSVTFRVDDTAPTRAQITAPAAGSTLPCGAVEVRGQVEDALALKSWELYLDPATPASPVASERVAQGNVSGTSASVLTTLQFEAAQKGPHTLVLKATDASGNTLVGAPVSFTIDDTPPTRAEITAPATGTGVKAGALEVRGVVEDAVGLGSWELYLNPDSSSNPTTGRIAQGNVSGTTANVLTTVQLTTPGAYTLVLRANDTCGNTFVGTPVVVTVDETAPAASISRPEAGHVYSGTLEVRGTVTDALGLQSWTLSLKQGGSEVRSYTRTVSGTSANVGVTVDTKELPDGSNYTVELTAVDTAGNSTTSAAVPFSLDNTAPVVTITAPVPDSIVTTDADPNTPGIQVVITATIQDANLASATLEVDGSPVPAGEVSLNGGTLTSTRTLAEGPHTVKVTATDAAETTPNVGSASASFLLDISSPNVVITAPAADSLLRGRIEVKATAQDTFQLKSAVLQFDGTEIDRRAVTGTTGQLNFTVDTRALEPGTGRHTFTVVLEDGSGATSQASVAVRIDNAAPTVAFVAPGTDTARIRINQKYPVSFTFDDQDPDRAPGNPAVPSFFKNGDALDLSGIKIRVREGSNVAPNPTGRILYQTPLAHVYEEKRVGRRLVRTRLRGKAEYVKVTGGTRAYNLAKTVEYVLHVTPVSRRFKVNWFYTIEIDGIRDQAGNPMAGPVFRTFRAVAR